MRSSIFFSALLGVAATALSPIAVSAQSADTMAPVPGPYYLLVTPPAPVQPQPQAQPNPVANPYSNPGFAQPVPYWMQNPRPQQRAAGPAPAQAPARPQAQQPRQYIPGWVWSRGRPGQNAGQIPGQNQYGNFAPAPGNWQGNRGPWPTPWFNGPVNQYSNPAWGQRNQ